MKIAIERFVGNLGSILGISPQGNMKTVVPTKLVGTTFSGTTLDTNFWNTTGSTGTGGAGATLANGLVTITTGTTANGTGVLTSVRHGRYVAGASNYFRSIIALPATTGANIRRWGAYDSDNGFFFYDDFSDGANHILKLVCRKATSDTNTVSSGSFNGPHGSTYILDINAHTYEIYIANRKIYFLIDDVLIHTFIATTSALSDTLTLPIRFESINSGNNTNVNIIHATECGSCLRRCKIIAGFIE